LEHLNILDEDYYFKLMDAMQAQSISDAILMYDEINRKGFEGDLVLNGFAEFIRNILVSKDPKVAILLEVAENFKQKYLETAKKIETSYLISALNVLNEAEINYKQARNKRLHVELTLIKLCYLQQALTLVNDENGVSKKKLLDVVKPVSFRALPIIEIKKQNAKPGRPVEQADVLKNGSEAKLVIQPSEKPVAETKNTSQVAVQTKQAPDQPQKISTKLSSLEKIRETIAKKNSAHIPLVELNEEELYIAWGLYIEKLREKNNHSGIANFKAASLRIIDVKTIEIIVESNIQQKFIENERSSLIDHLQKHFHNRYLTYRMMVNENEDNKSPVERPLSTKEQYLKMIEEYPLIKELKDRLKLELDF
jgi:DNA polymerase-3 subunit gamma/tau